MQGKSKEKVQEGRVINKSSLPPLENKTETQREEKENTIAQLHDNWESEHRLPFRPDGSPRSRQHSQTTKRHTLLVSYSPYQL